MHPESAPGFPSNKYLAFISYAHEDAGSAQWLHSALERFRVPVDLRPRATALGLEGSRLSPVFLDRLELASSSDLSLAIEAALRQSVYLIVMCSPHAANSVRVAAEVEYFRSVHGPTRILCVLLSGRPNTRVRGLDESEECIPRPLHVTQLDRGEPFAADLRPGKGSRQQALTQLAAGMLGVGLDALRRRELPRRQRTLWGATVAASVVSVSMAALAFAAWNARSAALESERIARYEAQSAAEVSQFLISVFQTSDPSESLGNTVTARTLLDRAATQIHVAGAGKPEIRSELLLSMGTVYRQLGMYLPARGLLEQALDVRQRASPVDRQAVSEALLQLALLNSRTDRAREAESQLHKSIGELGSCEVHFTGCALRHLALGDLLVGSSRPAEALQHLDTAMRLASLANTNDTPEKARILDAFGGLYRERAEFDRAEGYASDALKMRQRLYGEVHPDVAKSHYALALLAQEAKQPDKALAYVRQALAIDEKVYGPDHPESLTTLQLIGILHAEQGKFGDAKPFFERTLAIRERVLGSDHTHVGYAVYNLGHLNGDMGNYPEAITLMKRAQAIWERSEGEEHPDVAYALDKQAEYLANAGKVAEAEPLVERALKINLKEFPEGHPNVSRSRLNLARVRLKQGRRAEARSLYETALAAQTAKFGRDSDAVGDIRREFEALLAR
jgi:tetratricopeptide (TPR) repeat protein